MEKATPGTLIQFKDALSNTLLSIQDPWSVEIRTYRTQTYSSNTNAMMYSLNFSHHENNTVLVKNNIGTLFTSSKENNTVAHLRRSDCSTGFPEDIDSIILNKMTSLWDSKQVLRGDAGETFKVVDGVIRCVNLLSSTGFKGLIIEIEEDPDQVGSSNGNLNNDATDKNDFIEVGLDEASKEKRFLDIVGNTRELLKEIGVENYRISLDRLGGQDENGKKTPQDPVESTTMASPPARPGLGYLCDLGYQYVSVLEP